MKVTNFIFRSVYLGCKMARKKVKKVKGSTGKLPDGSYESKAYNALVRQYGLAFKELYDNHAGCGS